MMLDAQQTTAGRPGGIGAKKLMDQIVWARLSHYPGPPSLSLLLLLLLLKGFFW